MAELGFPSLLQRKNRGSFDGKPFKEELIRTVVRGDAKQYFAKPFLFSPKTPLFFLLFVLSFVRVIRPAGVRPLPVSTLVLLLPRMMTCDVPLLTQ